MQAGKPLTLAQVADGAEGLVLADLARAIAARAGAPAISLAVICRDGPRMAQLARALAFFGPDVLTMEFPAWDCLPYDRVSPNAGVVAQRMTALSRLARVKGRDRPSVLLTTVNAALQRVPARDFVGTHALSVAPGNVTGMAGIVEWLELNGFLRASTVREPGEYAVRGGILDLFPPGMDMPVRLDFFGDALETIRAFDAQTQRSEESLRGLDLVPVSEFQLVTETIRRFRTGYVAQFGACGPDDLLYEAVSEGRRYPGMEHWLPLFHVKLETLFDYLPGTALALEHLADDAAHERLAQVADYYDARRQALKDGVTPPYKPLPPERLYLAENEWRERLDTSALARLSPFAVPEAANVIDTGARAGRNFAAERAEPNANVFEAVTRHVLALQGAGKRVAVALWSEGARERMSHVLADHKLHNLSPVAFLAAGAWRCRRPRWRWPCSASNPASRPKTPRSSASRTFSATGWCGRAAPAAARRTSSPKRPASRPAIWWCMSITASAALPACSRSKPPARRTTASKSTTPKAPSCSCRWRTSTCCRVTDRRKATSISTGWAAAVGRRARRA